MGKKIVCFNLALLLFFRMLPFPVWADGGQLRDSEGNTSMFVAIDGSKLPQLYTEDGDPIDTGSCSFQTDIGNADISYSDGTVTIQPKDVSVGDKGTLTVRRYSDNTVFTFDLEVALPFVGVFSTPEYEAEDYVCSVNRGVIQNPSDSMSSMRSVYLVMQPGSSIFDPDSQITTSIPEITTEKVSDHVIRVDLAPDVIWGTYSTLIHVGIYDPFNADAEPHRPRAYSLTFTDGNYLSTYSGTAFQRVTIDEDLYFDFYSPDGGRITEEAYDLNASKGTIEWEKKYPYNDFNSAFLKLEDPEVGDAVVIKAMPKDGGIPLTYTVFIGLPDTGVFLSDDFSGEGYFDLKYGESQLGIPHGYLQGTGTFVNYEESPSNTTVYVLCDPEKDYRFPTDIEISCSVGVSVERLSGRAIRVSLTDDPLRGLYQVTISPKQKSGYSNTIINFSFTDGRILWYNNNMEGITSASINIESSRGSRFFLRTPHTENTGDFRTEITNDSFDLSVNCGTIEWESDSYIVVTSPKNPDVEEILLTATPKDGGTPYYFKYTITLPLNGIYSAPSASIKTYLGANPYLDWGRGYKPYILNYLREPDATLYLIRTWTNDTLDDFFTSSDLLYVEQGRTEEGYPYLSVKLDSSVKEGTFTASIASRGSLLGLITYTDGTAMFSEDNESSIWCRARSSPYFVQFFDDQHQLIDQTTFPTLYATEGLGSVRWNKQLGTIEWTTSKPEQSGNIYAVSADGDKTLSIQVNVKHPLDAYYSTPERTGDGFLGADDGSFTADYDENRDTKKIYYFRSTASDTDLKFYFAESDNEDIGVEISEDQYSLQVALNDSISSGTHSANISHKTSESEYASIYTNRVTFREKDDSIYDVTVTGDDQVTGSGQYREGDTVRITAPASREGENFANWTWEGPADFIIPDATINDTTFTMPAGSVTVKANYDACYIATAVYGSYDCPEVWTLRRYRDKVLGKTWYGRLFIHLYYAISPTAVRLFGDSQWFQGFFHARLDHVVSSLQANGFEATPYQDRTW